MIKTHDDDYSFSAIFKEENANDMRSWSSRKIMRSIRRAYAHDIVLVGTLKVEN